MSSSGEWIDGEWIEAILPKVKTEAVKSVKTQAVKSVKNVKNVKTPF